MGQDPTTMKRALLSFFVLAIGLVLLSGCESAPSTPLAPEAKMPDLSKMSGAEVIKLKNGGGTKASP